MGQTFYLPLGWPGSCKLMGKLNENINHLLLALIIGVASVSVSYIGEISKNLQSMAISIQELNVRMGQVSDSLHDHEHRLRAIEQTNKRR